MNSEISSYSYSETTISKGGNIVSNQIHPTAIVDGNVKLGNGVKVYANAVLQGNIKIGDNTVIGAGVHIFGDVKIGANCKLQSMVFVPGGTIIEDGVFIGPGSVILNDKFPPSAGEHWRPVILKEGTTIGGNVTILPGVTIGVGATVGAGAVVTKDVPATKIAYGNPARIYKEPRKPGEGIWGFYEEAGATGKANLKGHGPIR